MLVADAIAATLREWGVRYLFGVSGANIEHLHDAVHRLGGNQLRSVLAKTEVGAAFMADGHARTHRTLGVCCSTSGGGMMNLAVGVAESYAESVPVLALVGQVPRALEGRGGFQDSSGSHRRVDALSLWRSLSKYAARIARPEDVWAELYRATRTALSGRPGPVALLIPRDVQAAEAPARPGWFPRSLATVPEPVRTAAPADIASLLARLRAAKRPALILGTGVDRCSDPDAVIGLATDARIPVLTTMANPGLFPSGADNFLGTIGVAGHPSAHRFVDREADFIVAVGTGLDIMTRAPIERALAATPLAVVNVDITSSVRALGPDLAIEADAGAVFAELRAGWQRHPFVCPPVSHVPRLRYRPVLADPATEPPDSAGPCSGSSGTNRGGLRNSDALAEIQAALPDAGSILFDAGNCAASALHYLDVPPGARSTIALGMGGMGYAIAAAIGAQLGSEASERSVVICGDGAFLMAGLELHAAVELNLPILFAVFNNGGHGMCTTRQQLFFDGRREAAAYRPVSIEGIARAVASGSRLWTAHATNRQQLATQLADYRAHHIDGPGLVEIIVPREEMPPFTPFLGETAATYQAPRPFAPQARDARAFASE